MAHHISWAFKESPDGTVTPMAVIWEDICGIWIAKNVEVFPTVTLRKPDFYERALKKLLWAQAEHDALTTIMMGGNNGHLLES